MMIQRPAEKRACKTPQRGTSEVRPRKASGFPDHLKINNGIYHSCKNNNLGLVFWAVIAGDDNGKRTIT
ncbi:hypothetical protein [Bacillus sp. CECT 9360]|uniref:hypothetical protein n=1 Tax=Bacillus sp. CECT 9360 TaxID=2845821 RepID=UPI001E5EDDAB|nr:hypothetical protein [Bacillus sp. CECT 9360]